MKDSASSCADFQEVFRIHTNILDVLADVSRIHTIIQGPAEAFRLHTKIAEALLSMTIT